MNGMDDNGFVTVCECKFRGCKIIFSSIEDALDSLKYDLEDVELGEKVKIELTLKKMTAKKYAELPEFDGF